MGLPRWPSGKESTCPMQETQDTHHRSLGREDPLEEEITTYSSLFPWTEKPVGLGHILTCLHQTFSHISIINDPRLNQLLLSLFQYNVFLIYSFYICKLAFLEAILRIRKTFEKEKRLNLSCLYSAFNLSSKFHLRKRLSFLRLWLHDVNESLFCSFSFQTRFISGTCLPQPPSHYARSQASPKCYCSVSPLLEKQLERQVPLTKVQKHHIRI